MSWRSRVAQLLDGLGVLEFALRARSVVGLPLLTVLTYHRVNDVAGGVDDQEFDEGVIDATIAEFDEHVATLTRSFNLVSIAELVAHYERKRPLPPNPALITFDDGYLDCHQVALPILKRHGAKAVFFIPTYYVTERRVFWWDKIAYLIRRSPRERLQINYPLPLDLDLTLGREPAVCLLQRIVKDHYALDLDRFLHEVTVASGVPWDLDLERTIADQLLMTWDQIADLKASGMDMQSHTRTHRILQTLTPEQLAFELRSSREELETRLGEPVRSVAYPVGYPIADKPEIRSAVRDAGYAIGFSNGTGINALSGSPDPYDISRIAVESSVPQSYFRASVTFPMFAFKKPARKKRGVIAQPG